DLDGVIAPHLDRGVAQLSPVEHAVLLIGTYELRHCVEVPYRVAINEAVELAKAFGGTDGHKYVNGVLDKAAASLRPDEVAAQRAARNASRPT
ncbi:MAG: transcription antitermination protein NusB, partial [Pseudomonadota bacterium]|nr:transcription antitermination protein NusB [Pseudomonadota bacterium]